MFTCHDLERWCPLVLGTITTIPVAIALAPTTDTTGLATQCQPTRTLRCLVDLPTATNIIPMPLFPPMVKLSPRGFVKFDPFSWRALRPKKDPIRSGGVDYGYPTRFKQC